MATGSGKSKIAIFSCYNFYKKLLENKKKLIIIIGMPDQYLVEQWAEKEVSIYSKNVVLCHSEVTNWQEKLELAIKKIKFSNSKHYFIIGTYQSLNADILNNEILAKLPKNAEIIFIGDEAHSLGSPTGLYFMQNFDPNFKIGLSATPKRHFDEDGTIKLLDWFLKNTSENTVFNFDLNDAQQLGAVMRFDYKIFTCDLEQEKFNKFKELSNDISKKSYKMSDLKEDSAKDLTLLLNQRADLIKKSYNKIPIFKEIVRNLIDTIEDKNDFWKSVIYCKDGNQVDNVIEAIQELNNLDKFQIKFKVIDGEMAIKDRVIYIEHLTKLNINTLIAMKCLDQGVDIPSLEKAIFLSSSGSDLEHIQRAGRILRKNQLKINNPIIFDIIVIPTEKQIETDYRIAKKIFDLERRRINFFSEYANNKPEIESILYEISRKFR